MADNNGKRSAQRSVEGSRKALRQKQLPPHLLTGLPGSFTNADLMGASSAFAAIMETIQAVAARKCSVVITGETGTGKELVARRIHACSRRRGKVFVPVDCATLTGQLFESQLFGHTKGAFTGAVDDTLGFFRAADDGTIFLDEISEIPMELQAKLLRALQEAAVTPLGSTKSCPVDVRVLCATNQDLLQLVRDAKFRADLYYRLNVVTLQIPPLRERKEDIIPLAEHFLSCQASFYGEPGKVLSRKVRKILLNYSWPGNIRELANAMERAYVLSPAREIKPDAMPPEIVMAELSAWSDGKLPTIEVATRRLILQALKFTGGRKLAAARILGLERRRLNRLIEKFNISISRIKKEAAS